jgi:hypothetical protein
VEPDALLHPVGPLPARTYWVRRALVVAALVVAVLLLARWVAGLGGGAAAERTTGRPGGPTPVTASTPTGTRSAMVSPAASASPRPSSAARALACPDSSLAVTAATDAARYLTGVRPVLTMTVRNVGPAPCTRDVGPGARGLTVRSGSDRIWSSDDCEGKGVVVVTLPAGASRSWTVQWSRVRSHPGCPSPGPAVRPGTYRLYGALGRIVSAQAVFSLR